MNTHLIEKEIIIKNNTLSEKGREDIICDILNVYDNMRDKRGELTLFDLAALDDKNLVFTYLAAMEYFTYKYFHECGIEINDFTKNSKVFDI